MHFSIFCGGNNPHYPIIATCRLMNYRAQCPAFRMSLKVKWSRSGGIKCFSIKLIIIIRIYVNNLPLKIFFLP